ncbi:sulfatase-like hydrolase/transferase [Coraliomargarita algicola]|uniref:Sulfatase-like hydrolase/transferase n=1 Tax=Coraliomargarita algicola TaxID=3092156 RepID=A0ABZ0RS49_9BACT|nr:sulfatase-like hydrolase/transferase [Coraliomargarita sp. J2-16]WPJ98236.1 sulfatase-like hydrolase/transferase [Coraliomargarita sp. J2-16]
MQAKSTAPNFLVILTDDQSWVGTSTLMDPSNSDSKSDYYQTPHMDRLLNNGMRFSRGYTSTYCVPSRRALQSGQTSARHWYNNAPQKKWTVDYLKQMSIPKLLKSIDPNYKTAHLGKWHLHADKPEPELMGYDLSDGYTTNDEGHAPSTLKTPIGIPGIVDDPKMIFDLSRRGCKFMQQQVAEGNPFYLQISEYAVHLKIEYRQSVNDAIKNSKLGAKHTIPEFRSMIEDMDRGIGIVLDEIERLGIEDNTYIIFLSDNGGRKSIPINGQNALFSPAGLSRNAPLAQAKHEVYEGGIRVPFCITGPGIEAGAVSNVPVSIVDILPTIADLAGFQGDLGPNIDGGSFAPLAKQMSERVDRPNPFIVVHAKRGTPRNTTVKNSKRYVMQSCLIQGDDKLIKFWDKNGTEDIIELYDLSTDIGEEQNLAVAHPEKAAQLEQLLDNYLTQADAKTRSM